MGEDMEFLCDRTAERAYDSYLSSLKVLEYYVSKACGECVLKMHEGLRVEIYGIPVAITRTDGSWSAVSRTGVICNARTADAALRAMREGLSRAVCGKCGEARHIKDVFVFAGFADVLAIEYVCRWCDASDSA